MISRSLLIFAALLMAVAVGAGCARHYYPDAGDPRYDPPRFFHDDHDGGDWDDDSWHDRG